MRRRQFLTMLGAGMAVRPGGAGAQQAGKLPTIGFLGANTASSPQTDAFVQRLRELGWIDGSTVTIEYRWAEGRFDRAPVLVAELIQLKADVLVTHSSPNVVAAKQATSVIPIVFAAVGDPVGSGLVESLSRPGGNVTGLSIQANDLVGKRIQLMREFIPNVGRVAFLAGSNTNQTAMEVAEFRAAAQTLGLEIIRTDIFRPDDIAPVIESLRGRADAIYVQTHPMMFTNRVRINTLALGARLPTFAGSREFAEASGLMSYGPNFSDLFRRAGELVDKILRGTKPADLAVEQPTKFDLVVNLATAKALGLEVPSKLLFTADEVIE
ncbi:MAG: ABC transporter substrate-binding protein [Alphaproteobacteria bacterium]|nr:ABC transporter substrate-binding protein [Alphaproteobacteria bacterium]